MYRVVLLALCGLILPACSVSQAPISLGLNNDGYAAPREDSVYAPPRKTAKPKKQKKRKRYAGLRDAAPKGSFERAPEGSFDDRDYSGTTLNAEKARLAINAYRKKNGLKPLALNPKLTRAAKAHSRDLAKFDRISHFGSDGSSPWERVERTGYNPRLAAENVGTGQLNFKEVFKGWKESPGHNKNLLEKDATQMGIALVNDESTEFKTFWTLVLGRPMR